MKSHSMKTLALLGLSSGILLNTGLFAEDEYDPNVENEGYKLLSETELLVNLNGKGRQLYNSLSPKGKELAIEVASRRCNGGNTCKGLNACKTDTNDCAGKGNCKGTTKCAVGDKNLAVKLAAKKMLAKDGN